MLDVYVFKTDGLAAVVVAASLQGAVQAIMRQYPNLKSDFVSDIIERSCIAIVKVHCDHILMFDTRRQESQL